MRYRKPLSDLLRSLYYLQGLMSQEVSSATRVMGSIALAVYKLFAFSYQSLYMFVASVVLRTCPRTRTDNQHKVLATTCYRTVPAAPKPLLFGCRVRGLAETRVLGNEFLVSPQDLRPKNYVSGFRIDLDPYP